MKPRSLALLLNGLQANEVKRRGRRVFANAIVLIDPFHPVSQLKEMAAHFYPREDFIRLEIYSQARLEPSSKLFCVELLSSKYEINACARVCVVEHVPSFVYEKVSRRDNLISFPSLSSLLLLWQILLQGTRRKADACASQGRPYNMLGVAQF